MPLWMAVCGPKKSGKTSIIEALIAQLKAKGYRVATLKHTVHQHTFDREGTDSFRHAAAGADRVGIVAPGRLVLFAYDSEDKAAGIDEFTQTFFAGFDVVLCEGFRDSGYPKVVLTDDAEYLGEVKPPVVVQTVPAGSPPVLADEVMEEVLGYIDKEVEKTEEKK